MLPEIAVPYSEAEQLQQQQPIVIQQPSSSHQTTFLSPSGSTGGGDASSVVVTHSLPATSPTIMPSTSPSAGSVLASLKKSTPVRITVSYFGKHLICSETKRKYIYHVTF